MTAGAVARNRKLAGAGIFLAAAFVVFLLLRPGEPVSAPVGAAEALTRTTAAPAEPVAAPPASAAPVGESAKLYAALGEAMNSVYEAERVVDENAASVDLQSVLTPAKLGTSAGRRSLLVTLDRAAEIAELRQHVTERNLERVRDAAAAAPVAQNATQDFLEAFDARATVTLRAGDQLHAMELQSISTARHLVAFMEQNQSSYQLRDDALTFSSQGMQVQYMHYLTQVGQLLQRETWSRGHVMAAQQDQAQLVEALKGG